MKQDKGMNQRERKWMKVRPVFLLGSNPSFLSEDRLGFREIKDQAEQDVKTDGILQQLGIKTEAKFFVRKEEDFNHLNTNADAFLIFALCLDRFPYLISLASTGTPIIISGEEGAAGEILDTYEYLTEHDNVRVAFTFDQIRQKLRILKAVKQITGTKVCVFDSGERPPDGAAWYNNPLIKNKFKTQYIDVQDFEKRYKNLDKKEAESLAKKWMDDSEVKEPSLEDITKSSRLYIAMKNMIEDMNADAAYVLWCAQFEKILGTKMCLAITKLNDAGYLTGCWRGENLLPMLILHSLTEMPIFFGEVHTYKDGIISLRHCAVPLKIAASTPVLRRWRDREGTVTAYCEMPKGEVTLVNSGAGDRIAVMKGDVIDCRDLGGANCRTTVWIKLEDESLVHQLTGREFAMVYGDLIKEAKEVSEML